MARLSINPNSTGLLTVLVEQELDEEMVPVLNATVSATVVDPQGRPVATAVAMPHIGSGLYGLGIDPDWSLDAHGRFQQGLYSAFVTADIGGDLYTQRHDYAVAF